MRFYRQPFKVQAIRAGLVTLSVLVSGALYIVADKAVDNAARDEFFHSVNEAQLQIERRIDDYADVLRGLRALFQASDHIDRQMFRRYIEGLHLARKFPGIQNFNYAEQVRAADRAAFERKVRQDTSVRPDAYPEFVIRPPGERDSYHVITYIEPFATHGKWMGRDIAAIPGNPETLALARDSGELTSSGRLLQVGPPGKRVALAMRLPLYRPGLPVSTVEERRAAYYGSIGAGFDVRTLMEGALGRTAASGLRYQLYDTGSAAAPRDTVREPNLLFDSAGETTDHTAGKTAIFHASRSMVVGGRRWESRFDASRSAMVGAYGRYLPLAVFFASLMVTGLLFAYLASLADARRRAVAIAADMTRELRESEALLADSQTMAHLGNWSLDMATGAMLWSAEGCRIFGREAHDRNLKFAEFIRHIDERDRERIRAGILHLLETGGEFMGECRIMTSQGALRWIDMIARTYHDGATPLVRGTVMDVTLRKRLDVQSGIEQRIARLVATVDDSDAAIPHMIEIICSGFGWLAGAYFAKPQADAPLACSHHWCGSEAGLEDFIGMLGKQIPGETSAISARALASGAPVIDYRPNSGNQARTGSNGMAMPAICIAFPVKSGEREFGVIQCYANDLGAFVDELKHFLQIIGNHIGQFAQRKAMQAMLAHVPAQDGLTGLPNRHLFEQALDNAIARHNRYRQGVAVMMIGVSASKAAEANHQSGIAPQLLQECARRLTACMRASDIVARQGDDRFAVLLERLQQADDLDAIAQKIVAACMQPCDLDGQAYVLSASIGISMVAHDDARADVLLHHADAAMYQAKARGSAYRIASADLRRDAAPPAAA